MSAQGAFISAFICFKCNVSQTSRQAGVRWFEGQGYTTEAARAAAAWARRQPGVTRVRATIPSWHAASLRGAARLGMRQTGTSHDDVGEVLVLELSRADAALASR